MDEEIWKETAASAARDVIYLRSVINATLDRVRLEYNDPMLVDLLSDALRKTESQ